MCFANTEGGLSVQLDNLGAADLVQQLFAENPAVLVQVADKDEARFQAILAEHGVKATALAVPTEERHVLVEKDGAEYQFFIDHLRDVWYSTSFLLE